MDNECVVFLFAITCSYTNILHNQFNIKWVALSFTRLVHLLGKSPFSYSVCIYLIPPPQAGCNTRSIFKLQLVWIQSFPFPRLVAWPRLKNPVFPTIYSLLGRGHVDSCIFLKGIRTKQNENSLVQDLNWVTNFISYNDDCYAKCTFFFLLIIYNPILTPLVTFLSHPLRKGVIPNKMIHWFSSK